MKWTVILSRQAAKDAKKLNEAGLKGKAERLLDLLEEEPLRSPPEFEKLVGNLALYGPSACATASRESDAPARATPQRAHVPRSHERSERRANAPVGHASAQRRAT